MSGSERRFSPEEMAAVAVVDRQLNAYRAGDAPAFAACYRPDCTIGWLPSGRPRAIGRGQILHLWGEAFAQGPRTVRILARMVEGPTVIDHELVTLPSGDQLRAIAIFRVEDGLISHAWFPEGA